MSFMDKAKKLKGTGLNESEIQKYLVDNEQIIDTVAQLVPTKTKTLVLTNERLLVFTKELLKTTFVDYYFKHISDVHFSSDVIKQGVISLSTDKTGKTEKVEIKYLPTDLARDFYVKVQKIERQWSSKKREMDLEEKRASSGASHVVVGGDSKRDEGNDVEAKLEKLKSLKDKGLIDEGTYKRKYNEIIDSL